MGLENYQKEADEVLLHVYNRFPVVLDHGEGVYLYDVEGKKYLDFAAVIAVCGLGYGNPVFAEAMKKQIDALIHTSNLYYTPVMASAAEKLVKAAQMDRVFFTNSGAEAIEGALKVARRYAYTKQNNRSGFIAMEHSFHGRTFGALSVTGTKAYRDPFEPLVPGVKFAEYNNLESVRSLVDENTCAILMEPVQGEGGIHPADKSFLEGVRKLCDENDILLIFDEIQCGMGRTGSMFAWQGYGVKPDIMCMAKAIGNGMPVGAFAVTKKVAESSLVPGDHGTTYGGNPLALRAVDTVLSIFEKDKIVEHVKEVGAYMTKKLDELAAESEKIKERRGLGLIQGLELTEPVGDVVKSCIENGMLVISAGGNVLRIVPPLVITKDEIDEGISIIRKSL